MNNKEVKKYFKNKIPVYGYYYYVCFNLEDYYEILKKHKLKDEECLDSFDGFVSRFGNLNVMFIKNPDDINTIAHESFHMTDRIGENVGLEYKTDSGNEHYAYLMGFITEQVFNNAKKHKEMLKK